MGSIIDEDSDISDSEMNEYKEIAYKLFKFRTYKIMAPDGKFRCPFCADKEEVYQLSLLLLQHAVEAAESSKNSVKRRASHSAMAKYLVINSVELPTQECYQRLIEKLKEKEDALQKVRKALVEGWIHEPDNLPVTIGIKSTMGKLDLSEIFPRLPGRIFSKSLLSKFRWRCILTDNPNWYPFHVENHHQGITQKVVNEDDELLKGFKESCGLECYGALVTALNELLEYDSPHPVSELWNFKENRKAELEEVINYLFDKLKTLEKRLQLN